MVVGDRSVLGSLCRRAFDHHYCIYCSLGKQTEMTPTEVLTVCSSVVVILCCLLAMRRYEKYQDRQKASFEITAEFKTPSDLSEDLIGSRVFLIFKNGSDFEGIYRGMDDEDIMLESISGKNQIGLPFWKLNHFFVLKTK